MNINPPAIRYKGDRDKSISLKSQGLQFYNFLSNQLRSQNIAFVNKSIVLSDGSVINANIRKEGIYGNIFGNVSILTSSGVPTGERYRLVFALLDNSGVWEYLEDDIVSEDYQKMIPFNSDAIIGNYPNSTGSSAASALPFIGKKCCYGKKSAVNLAFAKYSLTDDTEYMLASGGSTAGLWKNYDTQSYYKTGLSIVHNNIEYIYDTQFGGYYSGTPLIKNFGQGLTIAHYQNKKIILISGHSDVNILYYIFGLSNGTTLAPGYFQNGYLINLISLLDVKLNSSRGYSPKGYCTTNAVSNLTLSAKPPISFITSHDITYDATMLRFTEDEERYAAGSKLIYSFTYHVEDALFDRSILITSVALSRGFYSYGPSTTLTYQRLTERDYTHFNGTPPASNFYNRDLSSIISEIDYISYETSPGVREEYIGFIKKTNTYVSTYVNKYIDDDYVNSVTEVVSAVKINLNTLAVTTTPLKTTTFTEISTITGSVPDPLTAGTEITNIQSGSESILECYYADYINSIYVLGKMKVTANVATSSLGSAEYKILLFDNGSESTLATKSINASGYIYNRVFTEIQTDAQLSWSLWESFRYLSTNKTGLPAQFSHYFIWRELVDDVPKVSAVFNTTTYKNDFSDTYYLTTIGGTTTITSIPNNSTLTKNQYPFITNLY